MEANNAHPHTPPYKSFGRCLKSMRQRFQESLGEVSGAVEIAVEQLDRFERGAELPNEDILMLLISHFNLGDDEAVRLWEMAGYEPDDRLLGDDDENDEASSERERPEPTQRALTSTPIMMIALDNRVLYTNGADIITDDAGVVINFMQSDNATNNPSSNPSNNLSKGPQRYAISRVGMSYDQAEQLLATLGRALMHKKYLSGPKKLPPSSGGTNVKK
jgi:hypothetical protein